MASGNEAQQVRCAELVQKLGGPTAEMALREARFGLVAQSLARSIANGADPDTVAQALAEALPSATTIRVGFRTSGNVLVLSSCLLINGGNAANFFLVPSCPSALQECLDSGLCGFYLRSDAHKPDLHQLWRNAPHTMAALCGAVPYLEGRSIGQGCAAALLVGIRRGDNSLMSADLRILAQALAQHVPEFVAQLSKEEDEFLLIPDPTSALNSQPSSSSHTPTSSSCLSSDNSSYWAHSSLSAPEAGGSTPCSGYARSSARSAARSSGSLGRQLPPCPVGVSIQEDSAVWEAAAHEIGEPAPGAVVIALQAPAQSQYPSTGSAASSPHSIERMSVQSSASEAPSISQNHEQLAPVDTERSSSAETGGSAQDAEPHLCAWDDDLETGNVDPAPVRSSAQAVAPAGFALFDSASSDPGGCDGAGSKGDSPKMPQGSQLTVISACSDEEETTQTVEEAASSLVIPARLENVICLGFLEEPAMIDDDSAAEESVSEAEEPGAMPARAGAQARRARAARAQAQERRANAQRTQQPDGSTSSYRQWASLGAARGGNGSDSDSPGRRGNGTPYRRRSPQHPFWRHFLDPTLEAAFVAWQAQQQYRGDILSAVLVVFVLSIELAHPSLEGFAFKLQACVTAVTVGALYMVLMQRGRWQRSRELLASCMHFTLSGAILMFVFPPWCRVLPAHKVRSLLWLFRFSGSEGCCAIPFVFLLRFRRAFWNQAFLLAAAAAVSLPTVCTVPDALKPTPLCFGLGIAMEAAAFVGPLAIVRLLEERARNLFLQSSAALLPHAD